MRRDDSFWKVFASALLVVATMGAVTSIANACRSAAPAATAHQPSSPSAKYEQLYEKWNATYELTAVAVGRAYRTGLIDAAQHDTMLGLEKKVEQALRTYRAALVTWRSMADTADLESQRASVEQLSGELEAAWLALRGGEVAP